MEKIQLCWLRRDLRLNDHAALYHALKSGLKVQLLFIFDTNILKKLPIYDTRLDFIHLALSQLNHELKAYNASLLVIHDTPIKAFEKCIAQFNIDTVFTNHDYEPYAQQRDTEIKEFLQQHQIAFETYKDQVIFEKGEVLKEDGKPYTVFTPYSKKWKALLNDFYYKPYPTEKYFHQFNTKSHPFSLPSLKDLGFEKTFIKFEKPVVNEAIITNYHLTRDIPSLAGTTKMSVHLRFGTLSIRKLAGIAFHTNEKYLNELIWRDFYQSILWHFPHVVNRAFKPAYDHIQWQNNEMTFKAWCEGNTGYPIVDAGMRELNTTGWMHNRVRMIVASFLSKHLLIDWRWGEAYFAEKLIDYELASNNGGWQWAAGCGVDAAPYFRIFNPYLQTIKFDAKLDYIKKWVPEFESFTYPKPIVNHEMARKRCLETYKEALQANPFVE
jgi:deoxyribodipyrimidine photo-lyase